MRRLAFVVGALVVVAIAGWLLWPAAAPMVVEPAQAAPTLQFAKVDVHAPNSQGLRLGGVVRSATGAPLANVTVWLASTSQHSLTSVRCTHCDELRLSCPSRETARTVGALLDAHQGELTAAVSVVSDAAGRFRFEGLSGTSFTVWGLAPGHGFGVKERAAPGDPVELFLPLERSLGGRLRDEAGNGVAGTVRAISRRLAQVVTTTADAEGRFRFEGLGEGPFYVHASAPALLPASRLEVQAGPEPVNLTLLAPRTLEVRLVDASRRPVPGVITISGDHRGPSAQHPLEVRTVDGLAVIADLVPGGVMVWAVEGELSSAPRVLTLTSAVTRITLVLERGGRLAVTVVDEQEQPVPEPLIELLAPTGEVITRRKLSTGEPGLLGPVAVGDYQVRASADGFASALLPARVSSGEASLEITLPRGTLISGKVIDEYGRPAPGVSVLLSPLGEAVLSGADGAFKATVPSAGLYSLQAHHSDWGGGEVKVSAPKEGVTLQLEPRAGCEITVTVEGRRIEGASVVMYTSEGNFRSDRTSGADGVVLMRGMPPNTYTVVASHPDFLPSERQPAKVEDGQLLKLNAELKPGAQVVGQVVDTQGAAVGQVAVSVTPRGAEPATSDGTGNFTVGPLRPNAVYSVKVSQRGLEQVERVMATAGGPAVKIVVKRQPTFRGRVLGDGQPLKRFRVDDHEVTSNDGTFELPLPATEDRVVISVDAPGFEPLMADRPNTPDLGDFDLKRTPMVTGLVRDDVGGPVADAVVSCDSCEQSVMTQADGRFALSKPALQHEFTLVAKKGRRSGTRTVAGDAIEAVEVTLRPGVTLSGTAWLAEGRPAAGVEIAGVHVDRGESVSVVTAADGTYSLELAPGVYRFALNGPGVSRVATDPVSIIAEITTATSRLDFGPAPGTGVVTASLRPESGYALWLVRGSVTAVGNPPLELLRTGWAQMLYQPLTERVVLTGVPPGRYTLVWASFHAASEAGPMVVPVEVPAQSVVNLVR